MRQPVRVVLADDHDAFAEGLGMVLSTEDDLEVVALAGDGASALQAVRTHRPDVLVVDTQMPGPAVTELVRLVGQARPTTRVLLLAEHPRPERDDHAELLLRSLSERERQVLVMLGVHSKLEAAALAVPQGLVSIEDHPASAHLVPEL